jgi:hypothetical protein
MAVLPVKLNLKKRDSLTPPRRDGWTPPPRVTMTPPLARADSEAREPGSKQSTPDIRLGRRATATALTIAIATATVVKKKQQPKY